MSAEKHIDVISIIVASVDAITLIKHTFFTVLLPPFEYCFFIRAVFLKGIRQKALGLDVPKLFILLNYVMSIEYDKANNYIKS
jgi:hypothetical protein